MRSSVAMVFVGFFTLLTGCASVPLASLEHDKTAKSFVVESGKSNIYLYRNEILGSAVAMPVMLDGTLVGRTGSKTYFMWTVDPGKHEITSVTENTSKIFVNAIEGKNHFIWQEVKTGTWAPRSDLQEVSEEVGRKGVLECKRIQPDNTPISTNEKFQRSNLVTDSASQFVVIDQSEPAFVVFTGIPKTIADEKFEKIKQQVAGRETLTMLTWEKFLDTVIDHANAVMLRDDYPNISVIDGLVCLVASKQGSGAPWGLTWNGGIALTFMDYEHTRKTYKSYKANPSNYKPIKDSRGDPVNPLGHLPFGGCT